MASNNGKSKIRIIFKLSISILFLGYLFFTIDIKTLWSAALSVDPWLYVLSFGLTLVIQIVVAVRLRYLLRPTTIQLETRRLLTIGYITLFYSLFLPAGIGSTIARWYKVTENKHGQVQFILVSVIEKTLFLLVTFVLVGTQFILSADPRIRKLHLSVGPVLGLAIATLVIFHAVLVATPRWRWHATVHRLLQNHVFSLLPKLTSASRDLRIYEGRLDILCLGGFTSLVILVLVIANIVLLFRAVGVNLDLPTQILIAAIAFLIQLMPISFAGVGVRETAFAYGLHLYGAKEELGALVGVLFLSHMVINGCIGGILESLDKGNESVTHRPGTASPR